VTCLIRRYRTPLCVLYPPKIIAAACCILTQRIIDGPHSLSLDARVSPSAPSSSLPTPPTHKPSSPDASRFAIEFFGLGESELLSVAGAQHLVCLLQYRRYNVPHRGLGDSPQFLRVSSVPRPPKLPRTIDRCEFFGSLLLFTARHSTANKVQPPTVSSYQMRLYPSSVDTGAAFGMSVAQSQQSILQNSTPVSAHGGNGTPAQTNSTEEVPDKTDQS
jgi:hypothetical protein